MSGTVQDQILEAAKPQLDALVEQAKTNFMASFGSLVESAHRGRLETLFKEAGQAKIKALTAKDVDGAREWADIYETKVASIETLGLAVKIVGDAKAASLLKEMAKSILDTLGGVAAAVLKVVISGAIAGLTGGAAPALSAAVGTAVSGGIESLASSFLKSK